MRLRDLALLVDDVRDAARIFVLGGLGGAVRHPDLVVGIAQQRERKVLFFGEFAILLDRIEASAEDLDVFRFVIFDEVPEPETFRRSTRCAGLRKKPQHDFLPAKVAELHATAAMIRRLEIRSGVTDFQQGWTSSKTLQDVAGDS